MMSAIYPSGRQALTWQNRYAATLLSRSMLRSLALMRTPSSSSPQRSLSSSSIDSGQNGEVEGDEKKKKKVLTKDDVESAAAERRRHEQAIEQAKWVTSWMMPWERAHMDAPVRPLGFWERVYWRVFIVLGGVGFAYETWVLGNRRVLLSSDNIQHKHYMKHQQYQSSQRQRVVLNANDNILVDKAPTLSPSETEY